MIESTTPATRAQVRIKGAMLGSKKPNRVIMSAARSEMKSSNSAPIQIIPKNSDMVARAPVPL